MNETLKDLEPVFDGMDRLIHAFKKDTYAGMFQEYMEKNGRFFEELNRTLVAEEEGFIADFAAAVVKYADGRLEAEESKVKRENKQLNLNMFMAVYFMPAVLEGKQAKAQELTDKICEKWAETFKGNNIKSADYSTIVSGFKSKLCYITTAVCRSLHKPEDCYELELLRNYRDNYLACTEEGKALVEKYYDIAPTIVKRIDKTADAEEKYRFIWETYLKPCINAIENEKMERCRGTYVQMVEELQQQYMITDDSEKK